VKRFARGGGEAWLLKKLAGCLQVEEDKKADNHENDPRGRGGRFQSPKEGQGTTRGVMKKRKVPWGCVEREFR